MSTHRAHRRFRRVVAQLGSAGLLLAGIAAVATTASAPVANAAGQSVSTTTNVTASTGNGQCLNPNTPTDPINCNTYADREDVWLSNLPQGLPDGLYFFAVSVPGDQSDPNDGSPGLLSSDLHTARTFEISNGVVLAAGLDPARIENQRVQLYPYAETTNGGGVYNISICSLADGYPVEGSDCTHDSFKVGPAEPDIANPPTIVKDAAGDYDRTWAWTIDKAVDDDALSGTSGSVTANYTVTVGHDDGVVSGVTVSGTITVFNPNADPLTADVTDVLSDGTVCPVTGGAGAVLQPGVNDFAYSCELASVPQAQLDNTATVAWLDQVLAGGAQLTGGTADFTFSAVSFAAADIDECVDVSDTYAGPLGTVCVGDADPTLFDYSRTWDLVDPGCVTYPNTAAFETNDTGAIGSDSQDVEVCKTPPATGARTIGFWQNKNGIAVIGTSCAGVGTYLLTLNPYKTLPGTSCTEVQAYVKKVLAAASAAGASMNAMLKAQMLATALDVYFTKPSITNSTVRKYLPASNLGAFTVDLTNVGASLQDVSAAFGGASQMTVNQAIAHASGQSNVGGSSWYGQVKATQGLAKNLFDAINNQQVWAP